ncbi:MAG: hypothetical protein JO250_14400 [Armatimonadetes bacterium]|nr:hypothetical protein [Armatimonadota bacterium]
MSQEPEIRRYPLLGREDDLNILKDAWKRAHDGDPQFLVLLAESGFGKTRLVQEFYGWLSRTYDDAGPTGYWPDSFQHVGDEMEINPVFPHGHGMETGKAEIPWLWWGIRCTKPDERRSDISVSVALDRYVPILEPHIAPIIWKRQKRKIVKGAAIALGAILLHLTPASILLSLEHMEQIAELAKTGTLVGKEVQEIILSGREAGEVREREHSHLGQRSAQRRRSLAELALDALATFLDPKKKDAPTVPVILILDDAQWADRETLDFLERLLVRAHRDHWPLLVVATHWEREWYEHDAQALPDGGTTHCLADVYRRQEARLGKNIHLIPLGKVADLTPMLASALPGLTDPQRRIILHRADGNPLLLIEIVRYLQRNPILFAGRDTGKALSAAGEERVRHAELTLHALARDRFEALSEHIKNVLGWSSYQGVRFLRDITRAIAAADGNYTGPQVEAALRQADHPLAFIRNDPQARLSEFRQVTFHEVARNYLDLDPDTVERVRASIRRVFTDWLRDGRMETLPRAERLDALQLAVAEFRSVSDAGTGNEAFKLWVRAMVLLHQSHREGHAWQQALALAQELAAARQQGSWDFDEISTSEQFGLLDTFLEMGDLFWALQIGYQIRDHVKTYLHHRIQELSVTHKEFEIAHLLQGEARSLLVSLIRLSDVHYERYELTGAWALAAEAVELARELISRCGETPERLSDLIVALDRVADAQRLLNQLSEARANYEKCLELDQDLVNRYGETPQRLDSLMVSLVKVAGMHQEAEEFVQARATAWKSLELARRLRKYDKITERLRILITSLGRIAEIGRALDDCNTAKAASVEALSLAEEIETWYGQTPKSVKNLLAAEKQLHQEIIEACGESQNSGPDLGLGQPSPPPPVTAQTASGQTPAQRFCSHRAPIIYQELQNVMEEMTRVTAEEVARTGGSFVGRAIAQDLGSKILAADEVQTSVKVSAEGTFTVPTGTYAGTHVFSGSYVLKVTWKHNSTGWRVIDQQITDVDSTLDGQPINDPKVVARYMEFAGPVRGDRRLDPRRALGF